MARPKTNRIDERKLLIQTLKAQPEELEDAELLKRPRKTF